MAILTRVLQKIFGSTGASTQFGKIGSDNAGSPTTTKDLDLIQSLTDYYDVGMFPLTNSKVEPPRIEDFNSLFYLITTQLKYLFQNGIPEWIATENYYANISYVTYNGIIYQAVTGISGSPNINNNPLSTSAPATTICWKNILSDILSQAETYSSIADNLSSGTVPIARLPLISRGATVIVAANDSTAQSKGIANYQCDGIDDDVQIQAAIDYCNGLATGGTVVCMEGTFGITTNILPKSNVNLRGQGYSTIFKKMSSASPDIIYVANAITNAKLSDFYINGNSSTYTSRAGIFGQGGMSALNNVYFENIRVDNIKYTGESYGFAYLYNLKNCYAYNIIGASGYNGIGFLFCFNIDNSYSVSNTSVAGAGIGFSDCEWLTNCQALTNTGVGASSVSEGFVNCKFLDNCLSQSNTAILHVYAFHACYNLRGCYANLNNCAHTGGTSNGFDGCYNVIGCQSDSNTGTTSGYGYKGCKKMQQNAGVSNTTATYNTSYADAGTSKACADTADGGYNS
jgi:hypothetical protein